MGVASEIFENLMHSPEGWFGVDNPVPLPKGPQEPFPVFLVGEGLQLSVEAQLPFLESLLEIGEELPLEQRAEDSLAVAQRAGEREGRNFCGRGSSVVRRKTGPRRRRGDDAVDVGMMIQSLSPRVQDS